MCKWCFFVVANVCPNFYMMEFAKVVSVLHHRVRSDLPETSGRWVWTMRPKRPSNGATMGKCKSSLSFSIFFCRPSGSSLVHRKKWLPYRPKWRSHLRGVAAVWGCGGAMVRPTKQIRGRRDDTGGWWQRLKILSVQAPTRRRARYRATLPQHTHLRRHTHTTALGPVEKTAVRLPYHAGHCCKRCLAIFECASSLWELEYCQSREGSKNNIFQSAKQH